MAKIVVNSQVMLDKADVIDDNALKIGELYNQMLQQMTTMAGKMQGKTIETTQKRFSDMKPTFETIVTDMKAYAQFLKDAAPAYESVDTTNTSKAEELSIRF